MHTTIAALATAPGAGGIAIIRISGPAALEMLRAVFVPRSAGFTHYKAWTLHRGHIYDAEGQLLDDALAVYMPGPATFTGEDVAELHCHGGPALVRLLLELLWSRGAIAAERGEFTRRAYMNGRIDLSQAEAVAEMISAPGPEALRQAANRLHGLLGQRVAALRQQLDTLRALMCLAVDFPDEEVEAPLSQEALCAQLEALCAAIRELLSAFERAAPWRESMQVALAGPVNAGKSSLLNALLGRDRALVSDVPGTTRDYLEERVNMDGLMVRVVDTAGLRNFTQADSLEAQGIERGLQQSLQADVVLLLVDGANPDYALMCEQLETFSPQKTIVVWNKCDVAQTPPWWNETPCTAAVARVCVAARQGLGLDALCRLVREYLCAAHRYEPENDAVAPNARQATALRQSLEELEALQADVQGALPWDLCTVRLESASIALGTVIGLASPEDVLNSIFTQFCIGK